MSPAASDGKLFSPCSTWIVDSENYTQSAMVWMDKGILFDVIFTVRNLCYKQFEIKSYILRLLGNYLAVNFKN